MCARTAWAWCSLRSNRRIKPCWKNGWPKFAISTNAPQARGSFPGKFSIRGNGAVERTRTSTVLLPPAPQAGASASSATTAVGDKTILAADGEARNHKPVLVLSLQLIVDSSDLTKSIG